MKGGKLKSGKNNGKNKGRYSFPFSSGVACCNVTPCNGVAYMQQLRETCNRGCSNTMRFTVSKNGRMIKIAFNFSGGLKFAIWENENSQFFFQLSVTNETVHY